VNAVIRAQRGGPAYLLVATILSCPALGFAQETSVVAVTLPAAVEIRAGHRRSFRIQVGVKPGYHVQANPVRNASLIPITVELGPSDGVHPNPPGYPPSKLFRIAGGSEDLVVYDGSFFIESSVRVHRAQPPGVVVLSGTLRYQACTDKFCLAPRTVPLRVPIKVVRVRLSIPR
jgi:hypothetical protein